MNLLAAVYMGIGIVMLYISFRWTSLVSDEGAREKMAIACFFLAILLAILGVFNILSGMDVYLKH